MTLLPFLKLVAHIHDRFCATTPFLSPPNSPLPIFSLLKKKKEKELLLPTIPIQYSVAAPVAGISTHLQLK